MKLVIIVAHVLALPDFSQIFIVETDASGSGIWEILSQNHHPIAYFSRKLSHTMKKKSAYTRELYIITTTIAKFRHYLLGHKFIIRTNQKSIRCLLDQTIQTPEQQAWLHKFLGYDFSIENKLGKENEGVYALSRFFCMVISQLTWDFTYMLTVAIQSDETYSCNTIGRDI